MSNKHASHDLRQALDDDFDPELLYPGIEEEEEEEDDDLIDDPDEDDGEEGGDEDRGDEVDPSAVDEDEPAADEPEEEPDLELLAELAGEGKAKMVPHARFNEVNETLKHERAERLRLEEELARARGQQPAAQADAPEAKPEGYDFDAAEDRYMDALLDGDKAAAAKIRNEIRAAEQRRFEERSALTAKQAADEELRRRDAEEEQAVAGKVLAAALAKYPFLDHESDAADADAIEDVIARRDLYMRQGMPFAKALATAVEKVGPRYAPQDAPVKSTRTATTEQIKRNLERERRIPAAMPGVGERGKDIDYAALSEDEFDALSEQDKRKARGDFVKADA